eukprot:jgi/Psemu1/34220/gm1.34220_g
MHVFLRSDVNLDGGGRAPCPVLSCPALSCPEFESIFEQHKGSLIRIRIRIRIRIHIITHNTKNKNKYKNKDKSKDKDNDVPEKANHENHHFSSRDTAVVRFTEGSKRSQYKSQSKSQSQYQKAEAGKEPHRPRSEERHMQTQTQMDALPDVDARLDRHGQRQRQRQRQHHRSLVEAAIDRLAIFGDSSLALMLSSLLLAVAFGLSLALEPVEGSGGGRFE